MIFLIKTLRWIYNTLAGAMTPNQIAYGLCLGLFVTCMPFGWMKAQTLAIIALMLVTRASIWLFMMTAVFVKPLLMLGGDAVVWKVGHGLLENESLKPFWTSVLNKPVIALFELDQYMTMGGFVCALVGSLLLFMPIRWGVVYFREKILPKAEQYRIVRWWRGFFLTKALAMIAG